MDYVKKGVTYDGETNSVKSCLFCNIVEKKEAADIVYEDSKFIVFKTIAPASRNHLLVSPKKHIQNFAAMSGPTDAILMRDMIDVGKQALKSDADGAKMCFHIAPWNSIDHLHLHAIGVPSSMNCKNKMKYYEGSYWCCSADSVLQSLETGIARPPPIKVRLNYTSNIEADAHTEIVDNNIDAHFDENKAIESTRLNTVTSDDDDDDDTKKQRLTSDDDDDTKKQRLTNDDDDGMNKQRLISDDDDDTMKQRRIEEHTPNNNYPPTNKRAKA
eukprot:CAMPEP_0119038524 /NCGR_PEP_ID=MMETSP1177-20130426/7504_1 /TAXON_ID=2985 /ORGANISM="Ochromonas sp, Strain CCMP1899" /LENGTH=271 /DNA_ID=CAMNT_0007001229 /DNA_START=121 /DNA_END=936 /DNA_ORIENTATION=+